MDEASEYQHGQLTAPGTARCEALLGLDVLSPTAWVVAPPPASVLLVLSQTVRVLRERESVPHGRRRSGTGAGSR